MVDFLDVEILAQPGFVEPVEVIAQCRIERHDAQRGAVLGGGAFDDGAGERGRQHVLEGRQRMQQVDALFATVAREQILDRAPQRLGRAQFGLGVRGQRQPATALVGGIDHHVHPAQIGQLVGQLAHRGVGLAHGLGDLAHGLRPAVVEDAQQRQPAPLQLQAGGPVDLVGGGVETVADGAHAAAEGDEAELGDVFHGNSSLFM